MKKILSLVIVIAVVLVAFVTCPDKQAHQDAVMAEVNGAIDTTIKDKTGLVPHWHQKCLVQHSI